MATFTETKIRALSRPGKHRVDDTLYLKVAPGGSKSWVQRLVIFGRRREMGLGGYPVVSLREARNKAFDNRRLVYRGGDPFEGRYKVLPPTFRQAAEATIEAHRKDWRGSKTEANWRASLEKYSFPDISKRRLNQIGREDVLCILEPIWTSKPELARKLRSRIKAVLHWGQAHGHIDLNVAGEVIDGALPKQRRVKHHPSMPYRDILAALKVIAGSSASDAVKLCLRLVVLTAVRSGEGRLARWEEIDFEARIWTIPADRMKAAKEHRIPLSDAALDVLRKAKALNMGGGLIFPSPVKRGPLSDMALTKCLRDNDLAEGATVHGFRSSFRDWCAETGKPREIAEAALAHQVQGVEGAYFRSDLYQRRCALMQSWAAYVTGTSADVVELHATA